MLFITWDQVSKRRILFELLSHIDLFKTENNLKQINIQYNIMSSCFNFSFKMSMNKYMAILWSMTKI